MIRCKSCDGDCKKFSKVRCYIFTHTHTHTHTHIYIYIFFFKLHMTFTIKVMQHFEQLPWSYFGWITSHNFERKLTAEKRQNPFTSFKYFFAIIFNISSFSPDRRTYREQGWRFTRNIGRLNQKQSNGWI